MRDVSRVRRRLVVRKVRDDMRFAVQHLDGGTTELTLFAGRRSLARSLRAPEVAALVELLTRRSQ